MRGVVILVITFTFTQLVSPRSHYQGMVVESWGEEFCRTSICALMPSSRWDQCCQYHGNCCVYVTLLKPKGPFSYEEDGSAMFSSFDEAPNPDQSEESPQEPPDTLLLSNSPQSPSARFDKLQEDPALESQPQAQPQRQPQAQPQRQPQSYFKVRPLQDSAFSQPVRTYNEVLEAKNRKVCRPRYCALLVPRKQSICCRKYKQCCAYVNIHRYFGGSQVEEDPFHFEKDA